MPLEILKLNGFKFVLFGDFYQLLSVESKHYDVVNSEVFSEISDGRMLELKHNYRAENDVDLVEFIADKRIIKNGGESDCRHMEQMNVENLYAGLIRLEGYQLYVGARRINGS